MKPKTISFFEDKKEEFAKLAELPLVNCWSCGCSVRLVSNAGLCELCQPGTRVKASKNLESDDDQENDKDEPKTILKSEINTDEIKL